MRSTCEPRPTLSCLAHVLYMVGGCSQWVLYRNTLNSATVLILTVSVPSLNVGGGWRPRSLLSPHSALNLKLLSKCGRQNRASLLVRIRIILIYFDGCHVSVLLQFNFWRTDVSAHCLLAYRPIFGCLIALTYYLMVQFLFPRGWLLWFFRERRY